MKFEDWGLIDYQTSFDRQLQLVAEIADGKQEERVVFCTHPPVVTLGRSSHSKDLLGWSGSVVEINRGGRATYHGPSQIVIYPLLDLSRPREGLPSKDIGAYLRALETWLIDGLAEFQVTAQRVEATDPSDKSFTGVWVEDRKIASIGIAVKRWVAHHGCALNLWEDPIAFTGINPCGFKKDVMTHLEAEAGRRVSYDEVMKVLTQSSLWE